MTTVCFVTYLCEGKLRRVGPVPFEAAEAFAKDIARKPHVAGVRLEKWACVDSQEFSR